MRVVGAKGVASLNGNLSPGPATSSSVIPSKSMMLHPRLAAVAFTPAGRWTFTGVSLSVVVPFPS